MSNFEKFFKDMWIVQTDIVIQNDTQRRYNRYKEFGEDGQFVKNHITLPPLTAINYEDQMIEGEKFDRLFMTYGLPDSFQIIAKPPACNNTERFNISGATRMRVNWLDIVSQLLYKLRNKNTENLEVKIEKHSLGAEIFEDGLGRIPIPRAGRIVHYKDEDRSTKLNTVYDDKTNKEIAEKEKKIKSIKNLLNTLKDSPVHREKKDIEMQKNNEYNIIREHEKDVIRLNLELLVLKGLFEHKKPYKIEKKQIDGDLLICFGMTRNSCRGVNWDFCSYPLFNAIQYLKDANLKIDQLVKGKGIDPRTKKQRTNKLLDLLLRGNNQFTTNTYKKNYQIDPMIPWYEIGKEPIVYTDWSNMTAYQELTNKFIDQKYSIDEMIMTIETNDYVRGKESSDDTFINFNDIAKPIILDFLKNPPILFRVQYIEDISKEYCHWIPALILAKCGESYNDYTMYKSCHGNKKIPIQWNVPKIFDLSNFQPRT